MNEQAPKRHFYFIAVALLLSAAVLGGGRTDIGLMSLAIFALSFLAFALCFADEDVRAAVAKAGVMRALLLAILVLPLVQLLPLPPSVWQDLPHRDIALQVRQVAGSAQGWYPMTLSWFETSIAFFGITAFCSAYMLGISLSPGHLRRILWLMVAIAFANVFVGSFQVASTGQFFDIYGSGHRGNLIGFLANRNHTAMYLASLMPMAVYLVCTSKARWAVYRRSIAVAAIVLLLSGILATTSRAGFIMGAAATGVCAVMLLGFQSKKYELWQVALGMVLPIAAAIPLLSSDRFSALLDRFDTVTADLRWAIWEQSWAVAQEFSPFGAGAGTFRLAYDPFETLATLSPQFVNNAHNDYLEVMIEAGIPGAVLLAAILVTIIARVVGLIPAMWRHRLLTVQTPAAVFLIFLAAHSVVDYPLRRLAIAVPAGVMLGVLFRAYPKRTGKIESESVSVDKLRPHRLG